MCSASPMTPAACSTSVSCRWPRRITWACALSLAADVRLLVVVQPVERVVHQRDVEIRPQFRDRLHPIVEAAAPDPELAVVVVVLAEKRAVDRQHADAGVRKLHDLDRAAGRIDRAAADAVEVAVVPGDERLLLLSEMLLLHLRGEIDVGGLPRRQRPHQPFPRPAVHVVVARNHEQPPLLDPRRLEQIVEETGGGLVFGSAPRSATSPVAKTKSGRHPSSR